MMARHCTAFRRFRRGRNVAIRISAERPMRSPTVPTGPSRGNRPLANAAPPCTLIIARTTAGSGGIEGFVRVGFIRPRMGWEDGLVTVDQPGRTVLPAARPIWLMGG